VQKLAIKNLKLTINNYVPFKLAITGTSCNAIFFWVFIGIFQYFSVFFSIFQYFLVFNLQTLQALMEKSKPKHKEQKCTRKTNGRLTTLGSTTSSKAIYPCTRLTIGSKFHFYLYVLAHPPTQQLTASW
jgi:hypothetical protein